MLVADLSIVALDSRVLHGRPIVGAYVQLHNPLRESERERESARARERERESENLLGSKLLAGDPKLGSLGLR